MFFGELPARSQAACSSRSLFAIQDNVAVCNKELEASHSMQATHHAICAAARTATPATTSQGVHVKHPLLQRVKQLAGGGWLSCCCCC